MAAPVFPAACHLHASSVLWILSLFLLLLCLDSVQSIIIYDRLKLFEIKASAVCSHHPESWAFCPNLRFKLPAGSLNPRRCSLRGSRRKRTRRRGRRAGVAARRRRLHRLWNRCSSACPASSEGPMSPFPWLSAAPDVRLSCLRPVFPGSAHQLTAFAPAKRSARRFGVDSRNLRTLVRELPATSVGPIWRENRLKRFVCAYYLICVYYLICACVALDLCVRTI